VTFSRCAVAFTCIVILEVSLQVGNACPAGSSARTDVMARPALQLPLARRSDVSRHLETHASPVCECSPERIAPATMPGLVRKLLVFAAVDGLVLQPAPTRTHPPTTQQAIKIDYNGNVGPLLKDRRQEDTAQHTLEVHGIIGM
jgi:hypothetical protein